MPITRLVLLLVILIGVGLLAWQNWSLPLSVVFLGVKTQELPLSLWILMAIASGALTSWILQLLSYLSQRLLVARIRQLEAASPSFNRRESRQTTSSTTDNSSDWEDEEDLNPSQGSEQKWDDEEQPRQGKSSSQNAARNPINYELRQEPKSSSKSGSVYSYTYREPSDSGVGKAEAVYDANYRVIIPSSRQPVEPENSDDWESKEENDEDWGFEDDDQLENEDQGDRAPRRS